MTGLFSKLFLVITFILGPIGKAHGVTSWQKMRVFWAIRRNVRRIKSLSNWRQHLALVMEILTIPPDISGDVVECGCFNGASTASLSLACGLTKRQLFVCDSFKGLPEPEAGENVEIHARSFNYYVYEKGDYPSDDGLAGVQENIRKYGAIDVCHFVPGYFQDSLKDLPTESIVMVFEDADLPSAVAECLKQLWPKMLIGAKFFCHEPWSIKVISLFYDEDWWASNLDMQAPGFFGSGRGILVGLSYVVLGYAQKFDPEKIRRQGKKLVVDFEATQQGWHAYTRPFSEDLDRATDLAVGKTQSSRGSEK